MPDQGCCAATHGARRIDPVGLVGAWVNTEYSPRGLARIVIERRPDALGIQALRADIKTHEGWGWTDAEALYAASASDDEAVAFTATSKANSMPVALHANVSKGLLIVSSFQTRIGSASPDALFAREFFRRDSSERLGPLKSPAKPSADQPVPRSSLAPTFVGLWRNTNSNGSAIVSVSFMVTEDGSTMHIMGHDDSCPADWGTTAVEVYTEVGAASEPAKIKACYDLGSMDVLLHGWVKQGVLVLALFRQYKDESGRSNYFDREFFYRAD